MPTNNVFPSIRHLLPINELPDQLSGLKGGLNTILSKIYYKDLLCESSPEGDSAFYNLTLVTYDKVGFEVPGTNGMAIVLNPDLIVNDADYTPIPVSFKYNWDILRYIKGLNPLSFIEDPIHYFELILELFGTSQSEVLTTFLTVFLDDPDALTTFVNEFNSNPKYSLATPLDIDPLSMDQIDDVLIQLTSNGNDFSVFNIIFEDYLTLNTEDLTLDNVRRFFNMIIGDFDPKDLLKLFEFKFGLGIDVIKIGLEFPRDMLIPIDDDPLSPTYNELLPSPAQSALVLNVGSVYYDSESGFDFNNESYLSFPKSQIGNTGLTLEFSDIKLDLSQKRNIPEAVADGRPTDFVGIFIKEGSIGLPASWGHNTGDTSTAELFVNNLLVGTGGISGTIGMRAIDPDPEDDEFKGLLELKFGQDFIVSLKDFNLEFQQNAIVSSEIYGTLQIPGFKDDNDDPVLIDINIHIGQNGEFNIVASAVPALKKLRVPGAFDFYLESVFFGREEGSDGRFYLGIGGEIDFTLTGVLDQFLPDRLDIKKMLIYDDGTFEFDGGKIILPKAYELTFGAATLSITGIHSGTYEKDRRSYKFFGFDGGVKTDPSGVDAHGKGIKFYYTNDDQEFDWFIRLESLKVEIVVPSGSTAEEAAVAISGFLSISEPRIPVIVPPDPPLSEEFLEVLRNSQEYSGGVKVSIPKFRGLKASASMRLNPKVPSFIVDLGIEMSKPILLGSTGLGIYGFRAMLGKKYVATKSAAGIPEDGLWWQYYKAKIDPDFKEGIQISKFDNKNGFSLGAGVSLATASDAGKTFSSKLFFLLSLPDVFLFQGQAQFLKERIGLDVNPDPPFYAIIAITKQSIEAGFGANYKINDAGRLVTVDGVIELGFFWGSSSAWYVNIGRETPEDRRIQARLFNIMDMYFYLMMSSGGIRLGAGVKFELSKKFGPLSAELKAYIDTFGKISKRPRQIGGAIKMGGTVGIKVCGFGFSVSGSATLAAEAPKPHLVTGEFEVCVKVLKKERCARFEFTWTFDTELDTSRIPLLGGTGDMLNEIDPEDSRKVAQSMHMVTGETQELAYYEMYDGLGDSDLDNSFIPVPAVWINNNTDDFHIPMDSFIDIEFKKGMNVSGTTENNLGRIGGLSSPAQFIEFIPPLRAKSDRVRHEFYLENIEILYWDETDFAWRPYDFYKALHPVYSGGNPDMAAALADAIADETSVLNNLKWGYWQQQHPGVNNKLRILATTPLSYTADTGNAYTIENLGVNDKTLFCAGEPITPTCVVFGEDSLYSVYKANTLKSYENITFRVTQADGIVLNFGVDDYTHALVIEPGNTLEIFFNEPMKEVNLFVNTGSPEINISYNRRISDSPVNGLTAYTYDEIDSVTLREAFGGPIDYTAEEYAVDYVKITTESCTGTPSLVCASVPQGDFVAIDYRNFIRKLFSTGDILDASVELYPANQTDYAAFFGSTFYSRTPVEGDVVMLTQGYNSPTAVSFTITDNHGFECQYTLQMLTPMESFDFSMVTSVDSVSYYGTDDETGPNNNFLVTMSIFDGDITKTLEFIGTTCKTFRYCVDSCSTALFKVCYLSLEDYLTNQTIPMVETQEEANNVLFDSINKTLQPIWRPNTAYAIRVKTSDRIGVEGNPVEKTYTNDVVYGFRTAGPVGHYHRYPVKNGSVFREDERVDYQALDEKGRADDFRLTTLKSYIDYDKSYPNADSSLINAKPLFYQAAKLRLFYLYNHVYQFYSDWAEHDHITTEETPLVAESSLEIRILNPAPSQIPEEVLSSGFQPNMIPHVSLEEMPPANIHSLNSDISLLNNLLINGNPCAAYTPLAPIDVSSAMEIDLKPLKLYTAQFVAHYNARLYMTFAPEDFESVVHSYVFQTSRYRNFEEQVNSYILKQDGPTIVREAVYNLKINAGFDIGLAERAIRNTLTELEDKLKQQYADPFERVIYGVLGMDINQLQTARTTEFNLVMAGEKLAGILIRNPEPFNNPKIPKANQELIPSDPLEAAKETLTAGFYTGITWADCYVIHSKDHSQMFVTARDFSFDMPLDKVVEFTFAYKEFTGLAYEDVSTVAVPIDLTNYI